MGKGKIIAAAVVITVILIGIHSIWGIQYSLFVDESDFTVHIDSTDNTCCEIGPYYRSWYDPQRGGIEYTNMPFSEVIQGPIFSGRGSDGVWFRERSRNNWSLWIEHGPFFNIEDGMFIELDYVNISVSITSSDSWWIIQLKMRKPTTNEVVISSVVLLTIIVCYVGLAIISKKTGRYD